MGMYRTTFIDHHLISWKEERRIILSALTINLVVMMVISRRTKRVLRIGRGKRWTPRHSTSRRKKKEMVLGGSIIGTLLVRSQIMFPFVIFPSFLDRRRCPRSKMTQQLYNQNLLLLFNKMIGRHQQKQHQ